MTAATIILLAVFLVAPCLCAALNTLKEEAELFDKHGSIFFQSAKPLFEDKETPVELLQVLTALGFCITDRAGARVVAGVFSNPKLFLEMSVDEMHRRKITAEFFSKRRELEEPYYRAVWNAPLAASYKSRRYGPTIRSYMVGIETRERKQDVAVVIGSAATHDYQTYPVMAAA